MMIFYQYFRYEKNYGFCYWQMLEDYPHIYFYKDKRAFFLFEEEINEENIRRYFPEVQLEGPNYLTRCVNEKNGIITLPYLMRDPSDGSVLSSMRAGVWSFHDPNDFFTPWLKDPFDPKTSDLLIAFPKERYPIGKIIDVVGIWIGKKEDNQKSENLLFK